MHILSVEAGLNQLYTNILYFNLYCYTPYAAHYYFTTGIFYTS